MSEYNQYVTAINKIFDYLAKMKAGWNGQDNINYIESIEEYKQEVIADANIFKVKTPPPKKEENKNMEVLADD